MADYSTEDLAVSAWPSLVEATSVYNLVTPAETISQGASVTTYYLMIGWDSIVTSAITVWQVTGTPDTTGASSGNPTISAATIRILKTWFA